MSRSTYLCHKSFEITFLSKIGIQHWINTLRSVFLYAQRIFSQVWKTVIMFWNFETTPLQTHHVYSMLKQRGNKRFHVVSTWNTRAVFVRSRCKWHQGITVLEKMQFRVWIKQHGLLGLELHMSVDLAHDLNPFYAIGLFLTPLKHHVVFLCFQRVLKKTGDVIWAKWS